MTFYDAFIDELDKLAKFRSKSVGRSFKDTPVSRVTKKPMKDLRKDIGQVMRADRKGTTKKQFRRDYASQRGSWGRLLKEHGQFVPWAKP